jgi:hypothetical protein
MPAPSPLQPLRAAVAWARRHEFAAVAAAGLALGVLFAARLARSAAIGTENDWDYVYVSQSLPIGAIRDFGELPLWTPYVCGGMPYLGNPLSRVLTPFFLLHLLFGVDLAVRLELVFHLAIAFAGAYCLARNVGHARSVSAVSALVFPTCSFHFAHFAVGHTMLTLPFAYLPWPLALCIDAIRTGRYSPAALAGGVVALMFCEGGAYAMMYSILSLGVLLLALAVRDRSDRPLRVLGVVALSLAGFGAVKFLPAYELIRVSPRYTTHADGFFPLLMLRALFSRNQDLLQRNAYQLWPWHEYSAYVSPLFAALALAGAVLARRRSSVFTLCCAVFGALAVGYLFTIWEPKPRPLASPWSLLHRVPPFNSLRVPARFMAMVVLFAGVLTGFGAELLLVRGGARGRALLFALATAGLVDAWLVGTPNLKYAFRERAPVAAPPAPPGGFAQYLDRAPPLLDAEANSSSRMSTLVSRGLGVLNCYDPIHPRRAAVGVDEAGYRGEYFVAGEGSAKLVAWSPGRLSFDVSLPRAATLVVNENFDAHFRLASGTGDVVAHDGLLAVALPAGSERVTLAYRCLAFWTGAVLTLLTAVATCVLFRREVRQR